MELEHLYQKEIQEFSELIQNDSLIEYSKDDSMYLSRKHKQKLELDYLNHLQDTEEPQSPVDFFSKFKEEEIKSEYLLTFNKNPYLPIYMKDYIVYFETSSYETPYISFNHFTEAVYSLIAELEKVTICYEDHSECLSYSQENMEKSKGVAFCNSWTAMMELILIYLCQVNTTTLRNVFCDNELAKFLKKAYDQKDLKIFPCKWLHRDGNLNLKMIKTRLYGLIQKKQLDFQSNRLYEQLKSIFVKKEAAGGDPNEVSAYIISYLYDDDKTYFGKYRGGAHKLYFSNNYFKKHEKAIMKEIKEAYIEKDRYRKKYYQEKAKARRVMVEKAEAEKVERAKVAKDAKDKAEKAKVEKAKAAKAKAAKIAKSKAKKAKAKDNAKD